MPFNGKIAALTALNRKSSVVKAFEQETYRRYWRLTGKIAALMPWNQKNSGVNGV